MNSPKFIPSPHHMSRQGHKIQALVIHRMVGTFPGTIAHFQNPDSRVSAHYLISQDGEVVQMVRDHEAAWHAGNKSGTPPEIFRDVNPNWVSIGIECEDRTDQDVNFWTQTQLDTLVDLCKILIKQYEIPVDRQHIVGHCEINPVGKPFCPGSHFPWDDVMGYLREETQEKLEESTESEIDWQAKAKEFGARVHEVEKEKLDIEKDLNGQILALREEKLKLEETQASRDQEIESLKVLLGEKQTKIAQLEEELGKVRETVSELTSKSQELGEVIKGLREGEKALQTLLSKTEKEYQEKLAVKEVSKLRFAFDTNKFYIRWIQIFLWSGLSAVVPAIAAFLLSDPRLLLFAPIINATAKSLKDYVVQRKGVGETA